MRTFIPLALLATLSTALTPTPTPLAKRDNDDRIESSLSSLASSATSALDAHPSDASSILSELREQYTSIAGQATGCGSSWARITDAVGEFDEGFFDGVRNVVDEIFGDDDECKENAATANTVAYGIIGAGLLGVAAVL
jgi:hypothetical protein